MTERLEGARFRRSPAGATALTLVALSLGGWGVINSPLFGVQHILVEGARELDEHDVRALAGVEDDTNLLRLSLDAVIAGVERSPWVAEVSAERSLPATLVIRVVERRPAGWLDDPGGRAVIAVDGTVLERVQTPPAALPSLGTTSGQLVPGERLPALPATLQVAASLDRRLLETVAAVTFSDGEVLFELRDGGRVRYGEPTQLKDKNRALEEMLDWAEDRGVGVESIDVRVPTAPALRPLSAA